MSLFAGGRGGGEWVGSGAVRRTNTFRGNSLPAPPQRYEGLCVGYVAIGIGILPKHFSRPQLLAASGASLYCVINEARVVPFPPC